MTVAVNWSGTNEELDDEELKEDELEEEEDDELLEELDDELEEVGVRSGESTIPSTAPVLMPAGRVARILLSMD